MKKKVFVGIGVVLVLLVVIALIIFFIPKNNESYDGNIVSFEYSYGGYPDVIWEYRIYTENDKTYMYANAMNVTFVKFTKEIDDVVLDDITKIVKENEIYKWDGFNKSDIFVSDGNGFSLSIKYSDGKEIEASGHMKYPNNYEVGHEALSSYLEKLVDELADEEDYKI